MSQPRDVTLSQGPHSIAPPPPVHTPPTKQLPRANMWQVPPPAHLHSLFWQSLHCFHQCAKGHEGIVVRVGFPQFLYKPIGLQQLRI
jgi:hypothetical protein